MQDNPFMILGISEDSTKEEVQAAYQTLHEKYAKDRFLEGEEGAKAARMYTKVEIAYQDALELLENKSTASEAAFEGIQDYGSVKAAIKNGDLSGAQKLLDDITNRNGDWHYWQAAIYYKKNWFDESKTQLKIALELDPNNSQYKDTYDKIEKEQNASNPFKNNQNNAQQQQSDYNRTYSQQQQDVGNVNGCCDCCSSLICADCCCEMMGGDLISCC